MLDRPTEPKTPKIEYINFAKRDIICKIILDIQLNQQENYPFPIIDHIHSFLIDVPNMEDKELYDLSLIAEPRNSEISQILQ